MLSTQADVQALLSRANAAIAALPTQHLDTSGDFLRAAAHDGVDPSALAAIGDQDAAAMLSAADSLSGAAGSRLSELESARAAVLPTLTEIAAIVTELADNGGLLDVTQRSDWGDFATLAKPQLAEQGLKGQQITLALSDPFTQLQRRLVATLPRVIDPYDAAAGVRFRELAEARHLTLVAQTMTAPPGTQTDVQILADLDQFDDRLNERLKGLYDALSNFHYSTPDATTGLLAALQDLADACASFWGDAAGYLRTLNDRLAQSHARDTVLAAARCAGLVRKSLAVCSVVDVFRWRSSWPVTSPPWAAWFNRYYVWDEPAAPQPAVTDFSALRTATADIEHVTVAGDVVSVDYQAPRSIVELADGSAGPPIRCVALASRLTTLGATPGTAMAVRGTWQVRQPPDDSPGLFVSRVSGNQGDPLPLTSTNHFTDLLLHEVQDIYAPSSNGLAAVAAMADGALGAAAPLVWSAWFRRTDGGPR